MFNGGIGAIYPFSKKLLFVNADIMQTFNLKSVSFLFNYGFVDKVYMSRDYSVYGIVSSENFGIIVLLLIMIFIYVIKIGKTNKIYKM